jgi:hypothetical protein
VATPAELTLRARPLLERFAAHGVEFIVIGGIAEILLGSPRMTQDLDICAAEDRGNRERLAMTLNDLDAKFRPPGLEGGFAPPQAWDAKSFGSFTSVALVTHYGPLDVWFRPEGTRGYKDLVVRAIDVELDGLRVKVAHIDDIIRNKEAIATTKYLTQLPLLRELREQLRKQDS